MSLVPLICGSWGFRSFPHHFAFIFSEAKFFCSVLNDKCGLWKHDLGGGNFLESQEWLVSSAVFKTVVGLFRRPRWVRFPPSPPIHRARIRENAPRRQNGIKFGLPRRRRASAKLDCFVSVPFRIFGKTRLAFRLLTCLLDESGGFCDTEENFYEISKYFSFCRAVARIVVVLRLRANGFGSN